MAQDHTLEFQYCLNRLFPILVIFLCIHLAISVSLNHNILRQRILEEFLLGFERIMKEASHVGTSVSFPKFSVSVSVLGLGLSFALVKKCTVTVPSFLGLYSGALRLLGD